MSKPNVTIHICCYEIEVGKLPEETELQQEEQPETSGIQIRQSASFDLQAAIFEKRHDGLKEFAEAINLHFQFASRSTYISILPGGLHDSSFTLYIYYDTDSNWNTAKNEQLNDQIVSFIQENSNNFFYVSEQRRIRIYFLSTEELNKIGLFSQDIYRNHPDPDLEGFVTRRLLKRAKGLQSKHWK